MIKATIKQAYLISKTKKVFICFNLDNNNKIESYILTNDLTRHRLSYSQFRLIDVIQKEINSIKFN